MSFTKTFLLFLSFVVSVSALTTPHVHRAVHHRALAGRVAVPEPLEVPVTPARRRRDGKRCKPRPVTSSHPAAVETLKAAQQLPPPAPTTTHATPTTTTQAALNPPPPSPTTHKPAPTTTEEQSPPPATTEKPSPPPPSSNLPSFLVGTQTGQGTWYGTGLGACGITNTDTDFIAAASHLMFDVFPGYGGGNPNNNPICGRKVTAHYQGKSVTVSITDRCAACKITDLDFSPSAFKALASLGVGRLSGMTWDWD